MSDLSETARRILESLAATRSGLTLPALVEGLMLSPTAIKEQLNRLVDRALVNFVDERGKVGRPLRRYRVTADGLEVFPRQYAWLSSLLLELLATRMGDAELKELMESMADRVAADHSSISSLPTRHQRLTAVAKLLNELGYRAGLTDVRPDGCTIEAVNCVYHAVAQQQPALCAFDTRIIRRLVNGETSLESCIARGGEVCRFQVQFAKE